MIEQIIGNDRSFYTFKSDQHKENLDKSNGAICFFDAKEKFGLKKPIHTNIKMTLSFFDKRCKENASLSNCCLIKEEECRIWFDEIASIYPFTYTL